MRIGGLQKTTLLDFPGKVSALVFTVGCNFHCPYCHNPDLVKNGQENFTAEDVLSFLTKRRHALEGLVISGGEPTQQEDLLSFCDAVKNLGYAIKLDTNGSRPDILQNLLNAGLVDYVAMDIKTNLCAYPANIWPHVACHPENPIKQSATLLERSGFPHEFRFPCAAPWITVENFPSLLCSLFPSEEKPLSSTPLFLQHVRVEHILAPEFFRTNARPLKDEELCTLQAYAEGQGFPCFIR